MWTASRAASRRCPSNAVRRSTAGSFRCSIRWSSDVTASLEGYDPTPAARAIQEFVGENLSNWYVRLNRKRFWGGGMTEDKLAAYQTLYTCLETVSHRSAAPFAPFITRPHLHAT